MTTAQTVKTTQEAIRVANTAQPVIAEVDNIRRRYVTIINDDRQEFLWVSPDGAAAVGSGDELRPGRQVTYTGVTAGKVTVAAQHVGHKFTVVETFFAGYTPLSRTPDPLSIADEADFLVSCVHSTGAIAQFPDVPLQRVNVYMAGFACAGLAAAYNATATAAYKTAAKNHLLWYAGIVDQYGITHDQTVSGATLTLAGSQGTLRTQLTAGVLVNSIDVSNYHGADIPDAAYVIVGKTEVMRAFGAQTQATIAAAGHILVANYTPTATIAVGDAINCLNDGTAVDSFDAPMSLFLVAAWTYYQATGDRDTIVALTSGLNKVYNGMTTLILKPSGHANEFLPEAKPPYYQAVFLLDAQETYMGLRAGAKLFKLLNDDVRSAGLLLAATNLANKLDTAMYDATHYGYAPSRSDIGVNDPVDYTALTSNLGQGRHTVVVEGHGSRGRAAAMEFHKQHTKPYVVAPYDQPLDTGYWDVGLSFWTLQQWCGDVGRMMGEESMRRYIGDVRANSHAWPYTSMSAGQVLMALADTDPSLLGLD